MSRFAIEANFWPLIIVRYPPIATDNEAHAYIRELRQCHERARAESVVMGAVVDFRHITPRGATAGMRRLLARELNLIFKEYGHMYACDAIVADSALLRGLVTAGYWLIPNKKFPVRCFDNIVAATVWGKEIVRARNAKVAV